MKEKRYITFSEFGDVYFYKKDIPSEILAAADDGMYDVIDITDPDNPFRYCEGEWIKINELPVTFEA